MTLKRLQPIRKLRQFVILSTFGHPRIRYVGP